MQLKEQLIWEFSMTVPSSYKRAIDYETLSPNRIMVYLDNGDRCVYNALDKTSMLLPYQTGAKSEIVWRQRFRVCLLDILEERGMSQKELSERSNISTTSLSFYMNGRRTPSAYILDKLARAIDCSVSDILAYQ